MSRSAPGALDSSPWQKVGCTNPMSRYAALLLRLACIGRDDLKNESERSATSNPAPAGEKHCSAAVQQSEQGTREHLFTDGVQDEIVTDLAKVRSESDQPHECDAIQEWDGAQPAPDRAAIRCRACGGRKCSTSRQSGACPTRRVFGRCLCGTRYASNLWAQTVTTAESRADLFQQIFLARSRRDRSADVSSWQTTSSRAKCCTAITIVFLATSVSNRPTSPAKGIAGHNRLAPIVDAYPARRGSYDQLASR